MGALLRTLVATALMLAVAPWPHSTTASSSSPPEARLGAGTLRGKWMSTRHGRPIAAFEGVPYAQPPVGKLRYKAPVAAEPLSGVRVADKPSPVCIQIDLFKGSTSPEGSEDCLYANIYAPETVSRAQPLPVMVWVHGGGFFSGSGCIYGPEFLLDKDVVLVTFNYRLGALGFLSTGDDVIPGNFGMKDQVQLLRWVRDNIAAFGGDPDQVTIFGESAGGASVHALTLSPLAKGLFHRAIPMSGTALSPWAFRSKAWTARASAKLAAAVGCPAQPSDQLLECLMDKPAVDIIGADLTFLEWAGHPMCPYSMTEEPAGPGAFLDKHPAAAAAAGPASDVPLVIGFTSDEGCIGAVPVLENANLAEDFNERFTEIAPIMFFTKHLGSKTNTAIFKKIRKFYLGDKAIDKSTRFELMRMMTDSFFVNSILETVRLQKVSAKSPMYLYELYHPSTSHRSISSLFGGGNTPYGTCHGDDLLLMFPAQALVPGDQSPTDKALSEELINAVTTFAATGAPAADGSWPPVRDGEHAEYLRISTGAGQGGLRKDFEPERMALWKDLPVNVALAAPVSPSGRDEL
ncbi:Venom carboxylesterase-6 [Frankliniella fusca]|uniref:Carboxylic ester hydrolase n=1 Tax=Frankliniella fusca TaxID=407009 RepID=A0AAE1L9H7_9NEOP|nr:Venom carboxylesterase-6 [Frankliniella fusca]